MRQRGPAATRLRLLAPMTARDPEAEHRAATPLELFFDLVFVVAVASASERLHHALVGGIAGPAALSHVLVSYVLVFFAIWWAWVNFTWFASAYDTDDVAYRLFVFVTMTGALILAAGVPRAFDQRDFTVAVIGYVVMRVALVTQWLRVSRTDHARRRTARRYALGITTCQIGWIAALALPADRWLLVFAVLAPVELLVPGWAERAAPTPWHRGHIAERYGLFTIIVLGESILAASIAIRSAASGGDLTFEMVPVIAGGLLIVYSMWWVYFDRPEDRLESIRDAFFWGYGHLPIFAAAAAVGAGLAVAIDRAAGHSELGSVGTGAAVAVPVAIYLLGLTALHWRSSVAPVARLTGPTAALLVLAATLTASPTLIIGLVLVGLVAIKVRRGFGR